VNDQVAHGVRIFAVEKPPDVRHGLARRGGQYYRWDGTCWPALDDQMLRSELYLWFENKEYPKTPFVMAPFGPTERKVSDL
jgi:hypothetical protein